ncbi:efflux RND transporter periplasmic adaptor subunit [Paenibacillus sp. N1-5-1-14]|uniref:efflux RND transporter periplasmic adaptor subunit n=1 Tax=Paenibacillus radicibacter TaxID=2972488 RepID=UPI002159912A|nr:efflux RND transporter periplasmic adaptor subunit [Paenibacillus radicibacter]MCR8643994.1 efflux RND transporter periplasmic adaptor subunit [Paenibacillus radicibacter]
MENEGRSKKKKWILISLGIAVVLAGAGTWFFLANSSHVMPMVTNTAQVEQGSIQVSVGGSGAIASAEKQSVKAGDGGKILSFSVKQGDQVKKGQVLVTYEAKNLKDELKQEELSLLKKEMDLESSQQALKENTDETKIEEMKINIKKQMLEIDLSKSKIQSLQNDQKPPAPVVAQIDGELITLNNVVGDTVAGSAAIGEIVNYGNLKIDIEVDEMDVLKVKEGMAAHITVDASPGKIFNGKVTKIASEGTAKNGISVFKITLSVDSSQDATSIKAGMSARAVVKIEEKNDVIILPIEAVQQMDGKSFVKVEEVAPATDGAKPAKDKKPTGAPASAMREVQVGIQNESFIEIVSGLQVGEKVVLPNMTPGGPGNFGEMMDAPAGEAVVVTHGG